MSRKRTAAQKSSQQPNPKSHMTGRNIMAAILQTKGPVVTPQVVRNVMTTIMFEKAAKELQALNLGSFVPVQQSVGRGAFVFVKRSPVEVGAVLAMNEDLCSLSYYESRYSESVSKSITLNLRAQLANMGLIAAKQLK